MKKILLGILALAAVACNNDVVVNEQTPSAITFGDSFVEVKTRGAEDPSTTTASINAFDVWGFIEQPSGTIFNQERVTRDANGWSYNNIQWWFPSKNYYFHAISPVDDANIVVNTANMNSYGLGNIAFTNVDGTTDLLYSSKHVATGSTDPYYENASTGDKVSMQFMHLLSKIKFTFTNGFVTDNISVKVTDLKIVDAPAKGDVDVNIESRLDYAWNLVQGETTTLEFGDVNGGNALAATASAECAVERLTIPADATRSYTIEFDVEVFCGTESGVKTHKVVTLKNQAFAIGKNYNIVAVLNNENVGDDALLPIEFDVITVEDWVENDFNGNLDYDSNQQPVALATPAVNATVSENTVTLAWAAVENADKYSVTVGTEMPVFVEDTTYTFTGDYETEYTFAVVAVPADETAYTASEAAIVKATTEAEPVVLYLNPNMWNVDGARYAAYMWNDAGNIWVSLTLAEGETSIYQFTAPAGYPNIIFCRMNPSGGNNWESKWNQTADLTVPTNGNNLYTVTGWDGSNNNQWTVYVPTPAVVALPAPVVTAEVDINVVTLNWAAIEGASHYTVQVDDDVEEVVNTNSFTFTGDYEVEYMFTVKAIAADTTKNSDSEAAVVTATTEAEPAQGPVAGSALSVADFLALADTANEYELTGKITRVVSTTYGNFDLTDATGTIYVYGLLTPEGTAQKQWAAAGLREGDTITIKGKYSLYNNDPQIKNATYVSHVAAPFIQATALSVEAAETAASIAVSANVAWTVSCDAAWVTSYTTSGVNDGTIEVTMEANETEEARVATFTFSAEGVETVTVKLTQKGKPAAGVIVGGEDDFHTIASTNPSYVSGKTTAGWDYKNCAIFKGGTSDSSPAFKMIGDASNRALCMNGKTSAAGSITSPILTTGCGTLKFNYGLPFSDTKMKFRVDIMQDGAVVKTFTIDNASASKLTKYSHEEVINVAGDFQIVFTNLSPSNNTGNKDRTAIWDVEWTGFN